MMAHLSLWFIKNAFPAFFLKCTFISVLQFFKANHNSKALNKNVKATERRKTDTLQKKGAGLQNYPGRASQTWQRPVSQPEMCRPTSPSYPILTVGRALTPLLLRITLPPILEAPKDRDLSASQMYSRWQKWHLAKIRRVIQICHMNDCIKHLNFFLLALDEVGGMIPTPAN